MSTLKGTGELLALGISHKTAPVALRERLAFTEGQAVEFAQQIAESPEVYEAVVISTCNRTEIYLVVGGAGGTLVKAETDVLGLLARRASIRPTELAQEIYSPRNCEAARQLYRVTAGLESMILGEAEIQGQVKRAYEAAMKAGTTGPLSNRLFATALTTGKRVRSETGIGSSRVSVPSVAVDLAQDVLGDLAERRVMLLGAGETSELTAQALAYQGVGTIFVANRHADRALSLAQRFGGSVVGLDKLPEQLLEADIVVSSTSSPHPILGSEELALVMAQRSGPGGRAPLLLIDIAVPRDIDSRCGDIDGVTLYDIDDLQAVVQRNLGARREIVPQAEQIVEEEIHRFARWLGQAETLPTVSALREHGNRIVEQILSENEGRWESASERDLMRIEAVARAVLSRLLHEPTMRLRSLSQERGQQDKPHAGGQSPRDSGQASDGGGHQGIPKGHTASRQAATRFCSSCASCSGSTKSPPARPSGPRPRPNRPTRPLPRCARFRAPARAAPRRRGRSDAHRDTRQRARTRPGAASRGVAGRSRDRRGAHAWRHHARTAKGRARAAREIAARGQVALGSRARAGAAGEGDRSGGALRQGHTGRTARWPRAAGLPESGGPRGRPDRRSLARAATQGACVGTSSVRRAAQLRAARGDLEVVSLRGNVDTRLRRLAGAVTASGDGSGGSDSSLHAIVLAKAGLQRLGRERDIGCTLDVEHFVPAPGQGALGLQARSGDSTVSEAVAPILDKDASACLLAERALAHALGASCNTPLGAHAAAAGCGCLHMHAWVGLPDGSEWIADELLGGFYDPAELGIRMAERLEAVGARELLARAEELAVERD